jgi:hypothetical protein
VFGISTNLDAELDHPDFAFVSSFPTFRSRICLEPKRRILAMNCPTTSGPRLPPPRRRHRSRPRNRGRPFPD